MPRTPHAGKGHYICRECSRYIRSGTVVDNSDGTKSHKKCPYPEVK